MRGSNKERAAFLALHGIYPVCAPVIRCRYAAPGAWAMLWLGKGKAMARHRLCYAEPDAGLRLGIAYAYNHILPVRGAV